MKEWLARGCARAVYFNLKGRTHGPLVIHMIDRESHSQDLGPAASSLTWCNMADSSSDRSSASPANSDTMPCRGLARASACERVDAPVIRIGMCPEQKSLLRY